MTKYDVVKKNLKENKKTWLITGVAGFIGSNLLEALLKLDQTVVGLDNFSTGHQKNLEEVKALVSEQQWERFQFVEGDIRDLQACQRVVEGIDYVLHQAALGSVPRSVKDPVTTNEANVVGFLNILHAAKEANVKSFTYAGSSSTYGDHKVLPKVEDQIGSPLSPYAVTKYVNELYADVFYRAYGFGSVGLRYFNVFGPRQDPSGAYAAVIPKWTAAMIRGDDIFINGDGETSRDFTHIDNVVQANILAATASPLDEKQGAYNVAVGGRVTLNQLFKSIKSALQQNSVSYSSAPVYRDFRVGDIRHSQADITKIKELLGYQPVVEFSDGVACSMPWYIKQGVKST